LRWQVWNFEVAQMIPVFKRLRGRPIGGPKVAIMGATGTDQYQLRPATVACSDETFWEKE
jgi:hypothetical protein